jgi:OmcA/MtrC family decaheme c-type cytochrome
MPSSRVFTARIVVLSLIGLLFAGCSGSDGAAGTPGTEGPAGPPGPPGPSTGGGIPVASAEKINVAITGIVVPAGGGAPTVQLTLRNDLNQGLVGLPAANIRFVIAQLTPGTGGGSSEWQSYVTRDNGGITDAQATTESATAGTYVDNVDGTYEYTFANALTDYPAGPAYDENKTHRIGIEIRTNTGGFMPENIPADNAPVDFLPIGAAPLFTRLIVNSADCNACHDNLEMHGEARFDVEYCVQCHNPSSIDGDTGNTVDMKRLIHNIHAARPDYVIVGFGGRVHEWSDLVWPQDIRNCETCHDEDNPDTPQASNWRLVANRAACGTCHFDDGVPDSGHDYAIENGVHPLGLVFTDDTQCLLCHGPDGTITNPEGRSVRTEAIHEILEKTAGEAFSYNIHDVVGTAQSEFPVITFSVTDPTNGDAAYNIHVDEPFTTCAGGASRLAVNVAWSTSDYANIGSGNLPGIPISMNPLAACGGASTDNGDGTFTVTSPASIPATATGSLSVAIEGHPAVDVDNDGSPERIAVTSAIRYAQITDPNPIPRRLIVDIQKCDDCHNQLSLHGNNRTDKPEVCVTCHNPMMTDVNQRGADPCLSELGADDTTIDFKHMIHGIHASGEIGKTYDVCGFRSSVHSFDVAYPGKLNNCEGCHLADTYFPVDSANVFGTTFDVNDPATLLDDRVASPNTSACSACHIDALALEHMQQNGGDFNAGKAADGTMISSQIETCAVCHGPGRTADVKEMHEVETFEFN